jgi:hypothetical protein
VYQGVSETASSSGVVTRSSDSATLVGENGAWVVVLPAALALLVAAGLTRVRGERGVWKARNRAT